MIAESTSHVEDAQTSFSELLFLPKKPSIIRKSFYPESFRLPADAIAMVHEKQLCYHFFRFLF